MSNNQLKTIFNQEVITDLAQRIKKVGSPRLSMFN